MMLNNLSHYTGIPKESSYIIDLIFQRSGVSIRNILLVLRKIRHNETLTVLGDAFGVSRRHAGAIFTTDSKSQLAYTHSFISQKKLI